MSGDSRSSRASSEPDAGSLARERERLEEELRFRSLLIENAMDNIGVVGADMVVRYVSPSVETVLGYRSEELVGTLSSDLLHPDDLEQAMRSGHMNAIADARGPTPPVEYRYRHKDGSYRYLAVILNNLMDDPSINGVIGSGRDVTERRRAEEEIRRLNETLEERGAVPYHLRPGRRRHRARGA